MAHNSQSPSFNGGFLTLASFCVKCALNAHFSNAARARKQMFQNRNFTAFVDEECDYSRFAAAKMMKAHANTSLTTLLTATSSKLPTPKLVVSFLDMIDQAFLEGQINGDTMELTYQLLKKHHDKNNQNCCGDPWASHWLHWLHRHQPDP